MNHKGFTLVEMVVVIVIIGIITIFSVPYFGGFANRTKLDNACRTWMAYANYARSQAVMQGVNYRMTCDLDQQSYWLTYEALSTGVAGQYISSNDTWGQPVSLDSSLRMASLQIDQNPLQESGLAEISFTPRGTANDVTVTFRNVEYEERQVVLSRITGLATIQSSDTTL